MSLAHHPSDAARAGGEVDVRLEGVTKAFGPVVAVANVSLEVRRGELLALLGPSGCGKTTILRTIAGFEEPTAGSVYIRGRLMNDVPVFRRNLGMVFQSYALFPHMNVFDNIAFGLRMARRPEAEVRPLVAEAMALVRLEGLGERMPSQLSGGQQQRVALARAVVTRPSVLLLDEPLSALDRKLREEMQVEIRQLQQQLGITTIFVTHDQEEALTMADRIAVMRAGVIEQLGTPAEVYERPRTRFVADFIGVSNFIPARVVSRTAASIELASEGGLRWFAPPGDGPAPGERVELAVRPEKIALSASEPDAPNRARGTVETVVYLGTATHYYVALPGNLRLVAFEQNRTVSSDRPHFSPGESVWISWAVDSSLVLPPDG